MANYLILYTNIGSSPVHSYVFMVMPLNGFSPAMFTYASRMLPSWKSTFDKRKKACYISTPRPQKGNLRLAE